MNTLVKGLLIGSLCVSASVCLAASKTITLYRVAAKGHGESIGTVKFEDTAYGMLIMPNLHGLKPGKHGFHVHANPSCDNFAKKAGAHLDPTDTEKHLGPYNSRGHLGDMPVLYVEKNGKTTLPVVAPRLKVADLKNHAIVIHKYGDNYSDTPAPLGGGGPRIACAVVK